MSERNDTIEIYAIKAFCEKTIISSQSFRILIYFCFKILKQANTMINPMNPAAEQVWQLYKDIENVIQTRFEHQRDDSRFLQTQRIIRALERLCHAILYKYNLTKTDHKFHYKDYVDIVAAKRMDLSTTEAMINAKVSEWEYAIPYERIQCGHDEWYVNEGRTAAYRLQPSLQETLNFDYYRIHAIVNTKPEKAWALYRTIEKATRTQCAKFSSLSTSSLSARNKAFHIEKALERLCLAVLHKYKLEKPTDYKFSAKLDYKHVDAIDIYSYDSMLDAQFMEWESYIPPFTEPSLLYLPREEGFKRRISLRQALNIGRGNLLNFSGTCGPLWGKSKTLEIIEEKLS